MRGTQDSKGGDMATMPIGKHKGKEIKDCPKDYLRWFCTLPPKTEFFRLAQEEAKAVISDEPFETAKPNTDFEFGDNTQMKKKLLNTIDRMIQDLADTRAEISEM